jgi:alpha-N-arabinofuranosidase
MIKLRFLTSVAAVLAAGTVATAPTARAEAAPAAGQAALVLHADQPGPKISRDIYGQFSEQLGHGVYGGLWVGEDSKIPNTRGFRNDVVAALKELHVPMVRWPGGCFADIYHWRDGLGPRDKRPVTLNSTWGGVEETNAVGLHEFMDLAQMIGAGAYINGNLGTGSAQELSDELEYMTSDSHSTLAELRRKNGREAPWKVDWFAIGNEPWGCGGNMRAEHYADLVRQDATFLRAPRGARPKIIASGAEPENYHWTEVMMESAGPSIDAYTLHYYTLPTGNWEHKGPAIGFDEAGWISTVANALKMDEYVSKHSAIMDKYDPKKRIALAVDEWGTWYDPTPGTNPAFLEQANTLRDAITAAMTLNIFHHHADRVRMASIAQTVNVLQSMVLTDGPKMVLTPTYWVFDMYRPFQDATALPIDVSAPPYVLGTVSVPGVQASAARDAQGVVHIALVNPNPNRPVRASVRIAGAAERSVDGQVLTAQAMDAQNTFAQPDRVKPQPFRGAKLQGDELTALLPAKSVVVLDLH